MKDRRFFFSVCCILLAGLMMSGTTSCGFLSVRAAELSDGYTRTATDEGQITDDFKTSMADFSLDLFRGTLGEDNQNSLVSPMSAVMCLALIANGTDGETRAQIEKALNMKIEALNKCLYAYRNALKTEKDCKLALANSVWYREKGLTVNESFLQTCADWYNAAQYAAPFDATTARDMNNWVKENTDGMIKEIAKENDVASSVMYLINTLVFDAKWEEKYEKKQILDDVFTCHDGTKSKITMMRSDENRLLKTDNAVGFAKNYKGGTYSFVGLLPDEGTDVYDFATSLTGEKWLSMWQNQSNASLEVKIPEFKYEAGSILNDTLAAMGMTDMFDGTKADFSALGHSEGGNLYCSKIEQKTVIDVSRNGTKAAAVTWGEIKCTSAEPITPIFISLDRPFVYAIVDNTTGLPLFLGIVAGL